MVQTSVAQAFDIKKPKVINKVVQEMKPIVQYVDEVDHGTLPDEALVVAQRQDGTVVTKIMRDFTMRFINDDGTWSVLSVPSVHAAPIHNPPRDPPPPEPPPSQGVALDYSTEPSTTPQTATFGVAPPQT